MMIRSERESDVEAIFEVTRRAFENHPVSRQTEQFIVNALRAAGAMTISLVAEKDGAAQIRAYPKPEAGDGELGARVFELAARERWTVLELRREEGRLDEVFRKITLPDTKPEKEREIGKKQ